MEVTLRKPQREIFSLIKKHPGSFIRKHKKSLEAVREYWRIMDQECNPIKNVTRSRMKPLFDAGIMIPTGEKEFTIKPDVVLAVKEKKKQKDKV